MKNEDIYEDFSKDKEMSGFSNYSTRSKYYDDSNKLKFVQIYNLAKYIFVPGRW